MRLGSINEDGSKTSELDDERVLAPLLVFRGGGDKASDSGKMPEPSCSSLWAIRMIR